MTLSVLQPEPGLLLSILEKYKPIKKVGHRKCSIIMTVSEYCLCLQTLTPTYIQVYFEGFKYKSLMPSG